MKKEALRIVFMGTPDFASHILKALCDHGANIVAAVTVADKPAGRGQQITESAVKVEAFKQGNWDSELVTIYTPYLEVNKFDILKDGEVCCTKLGIDFNEVYKRTNTSYKPIKHYYRPETNAFKWYSDYKSAASVERIESFIKLGRPDPVAYADETGPVSWEVAKAHVEQVLAEHKKINI